MGLSRKMPQEFTCFPKDQTLSQSIFIETTKNLIFRKWEFKWDNRKKTLKNTKVSLRHFFNSIKSKIFFGNKGKFECYIRNKRANRITFII